jgi:hypothetical protein
MEEAATVNGASVTIGVKDGVTVDSATVNADKTPNFRSMAGV